MSTIASRLECLCIQLNLHNSQVLRSAAKWKYEDASGIVTVEKREHEYMHLCNTVQSKAQRRRKGEKRLESQAHLRKAQSSKLVSGTPCTIQMCLGAERAMAKILELEHLLHFLTYG